MKTQELFEAWSKKKKVEVPDWVKQEDQVFKSMLARFALETKAKPQLNKDLWMFGGDIKDANKSEFMLSLEKRVAGLQLEVAKHLFSLMKQGREVVTYDTSYYGHSMWPSTRLDKRPIYPDDSLAYVTSRVKDKLFVNQISGGGYSIIFQYGLSEPVKPKEEPKPVEKKVYRVVKGTK